MTWERARKPAQKAARRDAIISAAQRLFVDLDYDEISLNAIAREAGVSKPNVYRYFATREEIFLAIFAAESRAVIDALVSRLGRVRARDRARAVSKVWVTTAVDHPDWLQLLPRLSTSMERNSSDEQIAQFKRDGIAQLGQLAAALQRAMPAVPAARWPDIIKSIYALMTGLWPLSHPTDNVQAVCEQLGDDYMPWPFEALLQSSIHALLSQAAVS